ncbi:4,5-dioxygenase [Endozoicomonas sp. OPT23]|uniref:DOPA 4,5-dioxygenase family protein n=1 Tax=Endozoicomonas sp. OPT23 TaxID=2072845 RepID=UPI00129B1D63|nr:DOPA 4,5-dioxygenase family protein [Endozoicomonas sp. OPT23]MRI34020.1 4,5-dioxygenase [Endozoicomonas sp. OPT23]
MSGIKRPVNAHDFYHAHVYFDAETVDYASQFFSSAGEKFGLKVGRVHQKLVGPHTRWSCQILFAAKDFDALIPWLEENRKGLSVLVHGDTGNDLRDHTEYAYWLGKPVEINLSVLK